MRVKLEMFGFIFVRDFHQRHVYDKIRYFLRLLKKFNSKMAELGVPINAPETLDSFLHKMETPIRGKKEFFYYNYFTFCNSILTKNTISDAVVNFLWILITFLDDVGIAATCIPIGQNLSFDDEEIESNLFKDLVIQQIVFVICCILLIAIIYQCLFYFQNGSSNNLSKAKANVLYFSFYFLPQIAAPICGYLFGELILEGFNEAVVSSTALFSALALFLLFFLLILSRSSFLNIVAYNISPKISLFTSYTNTFNSKDLLMFFLATMFLPFRATRWYFLCAISAFISFIWGITKLVLNILIPFCNPTANFLASRLCVDAITFGAFGLITTWIPFDRQLLVEIWALLFFLNVILTYIHQQYWYKQTLNALTPTNDRHFSEDQILKPLNALTFLRIGISYKLENSVSLDFLQFVLFHRFSEDALADIIRICISRNIPLTDLYYYPFVVKRKNIMRMRFLAMQISFLQRMKLGDDSQEVQDTLSRLQHEVDSLETTTDNFWTDRDTKQNSIIDLAAEVKRVAKLQRLSTSEFIDSSEIIEHWKQFAEITLCAPENEGYLPPPLFKSIYPISNKNPFSFGMNIKEMNNSKTPASSLSIESYVDRLVDSINLPFKIIFGIGIFIFIALIIAADIAYYQKVNAALVLANQYNNMVQLTVALAHKVLKETDRVISLPSNQEISSTLGISDSEALLFRQRISINTPSVSDAAQYLTTLENFESADPPEDCTNISVSIMAHMDVRVLQNAAVDPHYKTCFNHWTYLHIDNIYHQMVSLIESFEPSQSVRRTLVMIVPSAVLSGIFLIAMIFILIYMKKKIKKVLEVLSQITAVKQQKTESKEPDFSLYVSLLFIHVVLFVAIIMLFATVFISEYSSIDSVTYDLLNQTDAIAVIIRESFLMLSYSEQTMTSDPSYAERLQEWNEHSRNLIIEKVQYLSYFSINSYLISIDPLIEFSSQTPSTYATMLLALSQMLSNPADTINNFYFLMSRYIIITNITNLLTTTLPAMIYASDSAIQSESTTLWAWSMLFFVLMLFLVIFTLYFISRQNLWLYGVKYILRREMSVSHNRMKSIIRLFEGDRDPIIEKIPQPSFITQNGTIISCNELGAHLTGLTVPQMLGQKISDYFGEFESIKTLTINNCVMTFKFIQEQFCGNLKLIMIHDISKYARDQEKEHVISELLKPDIDSVPLKTNMFVICMTFESKMDHISPLFKEITEIEREFKIIKRIAISPTYYKGVVISLLNENSAELTIRFAAKVLEIAHETATIAITQGLGTVCGVIDHNTIDIVCGNANFRANELTRNVPSGRCFVDYTIAEMLPQPLEDYFTNPSVVPLVISPLTKP